MEEWMESIADYPPWLQLLILGLSTLVSEDLTTITSGILVAQQTISPTVAVLGCFLGIFIGDGMLYVVGLTIGRPALKLPFLRQMMTVEKVDHCAHWFRANGFSVIMISRFIPGTRLPTYFAAGLVGAPLGPFLLASGLAVAIWTPGLVYLSWLMGDRLLMLVEANQRYRWPIMILGILTFFVILRLVTKLGDWKVRRRLKSRLKRFTRWEFWPIAVVYLPVFIYNLWLALKYRRGFLPLLANPGIELSGYVGESKSQILDAFDKSQEAFFSRYLLVPEGPGSEERLRRVCAWMEETGVTYPLVLKPDVGQRGAGVHRISNEAALVAYIDACPLAINAQEYAPGPYEFGVFYRRFPGQEEGEITSLTGKEFPKIVGDGKRTIEELILRNPDGLGRYHIYLERFESRLDEVLVEGYALPLVRAGNHCLGTIFNDSGHLITDQLVARIDAISKSIPGFYIGRYDIRAENLEDFRMGEAFKIIELNGAAGEPAHIYDPRHSLINVYRVLFRQYRELWAIGKSNEQAGLKPIPLRLLLQAFLKYRSQEKKHPSSD